MTDRPVPFIGALRTPWLRPAAQGLRSLGVLVGGLAALSQGFRPIDGAVLFLLAAFVAWRAVPVAIEMARIRDVIALELLLALGAVVATGGWSSPWLLSLLVALGLAALGLSLVRATVMGFGVLAVVSVATIGRFPSASETSTRVTTLLVVVLFAAISRRVLLDIGGEPDEALGQLETLWSVRALLEGLHSSVARSPAKFSVEEALLTVRRSSPVLAQAGVFAVLALGESGTLRVVGAVGLAEGHLRVRDLPARVGQPRRDAEAIGLRLAGGGLGRHSAHGTYMWLPVEVDLAPHVVVLEYQDEGVALDDVLPELRRLAQPLAITVSNAAWFSRVQHLSVDEERQRIAARLHDQFAQALAVISMQLELAARRHPDDESLRELRRNVGDTLGGLRDTMVELRATVTEETGLGDLLDALMRRQAERHGIVATVTSAGDGPRPPQVVEQQLLRIAQELTRRAVEERSATAVYVDLTTSPTALVLEVRDDGDAPASDQQEAATDVIADRVEAIGAITEALYLDEGLSAVRVSLATADAGGRSQHRPRG